MQRDAACRSMTFFVLVLADKSKRLTSNCVVCDTEKDDELGYHEYAYCENDKLGYGIYPYMMCEACILKLYNMLSKETIEAYHKFIDTHLGLPPEFTLKDEKVDSTVLFI